MTRSASRICDSPFGIYPMTTIWPSLVHAAIMLLRALIDEAERSNLLGEVPASTLVAVVLRALLPRARSGSTDPLDTYI